jgi:hypothetical protein
MSLDRRASAWFAFGAIGTGAAIVAVVAAASRTPAAPVVPKSPPVATHAVKRTYDPLARALVPAKITNREAQIPPQCFAKAGPGRNGCWTCHTNGVGPNTLSDVDLQTSHDFPEAARTVPWRNLFAAPEPAPWIDPDVLANAADPASDEALLAWIRVDNYRPLREALAERAFAGPDLDLAQGFDDDGFATDGTGWRALRYKPFPGAFWPTNGGSAGDVFVRLPRPFGVDEKGAPSREILRLNYAILEASFASDPRSEVDREVEPVDERLIEFDLDRDGVIGEARRIRALPTRYAGGARETTVHRLLFPIGTEFFHTVRYLDPDAPGLLATRMKEVRYARKAHDLDAWGRQRAYEKEADEKDEGKPAIYTGDPTVGLKNAFGWQLQAFIEDEGGRLRLQTMEEHRSCMGCHAGLGITADSTFSFARKLPGREGFRVQDLRGVADAPQVGHAAPETLEYFQRLGAGDDFHGNDELRARFFRGGRVDAKEVQRGAPGGDRDLAWIVAPSRARAIALDRAYLALVRTQRFDLGRDANLARPALGAHEKIESEESGVPKQEIYRDARLQLDWR